MKINFKQLFKSKKSLILIIALVLCVCSCIVIFVIKPFGKSKSSEQRTTTVQNGSITVSVTGSGSVAASQDEDITASVSSNATVKKVCHKDGDEVKAGDVLFQLDTTDAESNVLKNSLSLEQAQLSQNTVLKNIKNLTVTAPFSGYISNIAVKVGDTLNKDGNILTLTDGSKLSVSLPFSYADIKKLKINEKVYLSSPNFANTIVGTISSLGNNSYISDNGEELSNVKVTIINPGALKNNIKVSGYVSTTSGQISSADTGTLEYGNTKILKNESGGTIKLLSVNDNQYVKKGAVLAVIENDELTQTKISNEMNLSNLKLQLAQAKELLNNYTIKAPFDGVISDSAVKTGDEVKASDVLCKISDNKHLTVDIDIDELDISKIKVGQDAAITLDALSDTTANPIPCKITKIATVSSSSDGVTTYPVTLTILKTDNLKIGMNADATITISNKKNILTVPVEAVQKIGDNSFVFVKGSSSTSNTSSQPASNSNKSAKRRMNKLTSNTYYQGASLVPIKTGINDETNIEVTSGLTKGAVVVLPELSSSQSSNSTTTQSSGLGGMSGGMSGGMGGNMGGPPSGGGMNGSSRSKKSSNK